MLKSACKDCSLSVGGGWNCRKGWGNPAAPLVILLDAPGDIQGEKLLIWIMYRLSLTAEDVYVDYLVKCPLPKGKSKKADILAYYKICWTSHPRTEVLENKSLVVAGNWGAQFLCDKTMKELHGKCDPDTGVWVAYGFSYLLMNPAECVDAWRVIYKAAEECGLKPKMNLNTPAFRFPTRKL